MYPFDTDETDKIEDQSFLHLLGEAKSVYMEDKTRVREFSIIHATPNIQRNSSIKKQAKKAIKHTKKTVKKTQFII